MVAGTAVTAETADLSRVGSEYRFLPALIGDQLRPNISFGADGGYMVTHDNSIDGNGFGIRARRFYADLSGSRFTFQVNSEHAGNQQDARVAMLSDGGAVFAWQGSTAAGQRIYVRVLKADGTFTGPEIPVSEVVQGNQEDVAVTALSDGSAVVVWSELDRDGSMQGVFGQRISSTGVRLGGTFQVNQVSLFGQRSPAVTALGNGGFTIAWITEQQRHRNSVDIYARNYDGQGKPTGSEYRLNSSEKICANPALAPISGGFQAAWSARLVKYPSVVGSEEDGEVVTGLAVATPESWDVATRAFDLSGNPSGGEMVVNSTTKGDQFSPRLASVGGGQIVVWTSYGQDGADEGIYGRLIGGGALHGDEFLVNTRTITKQIHPTVGVMGNRFVVAWASFTGGLNSYDLFAQQYSIEVDSTLAQPAAPFASGLSQNSICVTWPEIGGQDVAAYLVYVDDAITPEESTGGMVTLTRSEWAPGSTHSVRIAYRTGAGEVSPLSDAVTVKTWGEDSNGDSLPDDWQTENWGKLRPGPDVDSDGDGATNMAEFLAGTDPTNPESVLQVGISPRELGLYVEWRTEPGSFYQLQVTSDFEVWQNIGTPRFAPSTSDSLPVSDPSQIRYYRVIRMR